MKRTKLMLLVCLIFIVFIVAFTFPKASSADTVGGSCGENLTWTLDERGNLLISGFGDMDDYRNIYSAPWYSYGRVKSVSFSGNVTSIGTNAFYDCSMLESVVIPNSMTKIGIQAFTGCSSLTSINIPESVTSIGNGTFSGCSSLTSIIIPKSVTTIGERAFQDCSGFTSIIIPESVTSIGDRAFQSCTGLTSVILNKLAYKEEAFPRLSSSIIHYYYDVSYNNDGNGTVSGKARSYYNDVVELKINPNRYYEIETVILDYDDNQHEIAPNDNGKYICLMPDSKTGVTCRVTFKKKTFYKIEIIEATGTVSSSAGTATSSPQSSAVEGEEVILTVKPFDGYEFAYILVNGNRINDTKFLMPAENVKVKVCFKRSLYKISIGNVINGTLSVSRSSAYMNEIIKVSAKPDIGYDLDTIIVNGKRINGTSFEMPNTNAIVEATFITHSLMYYDKREPTCINEGYEGYYKCRKCKELFSDSEGKKPISEPIAIKRISHKPKAIHELAPTKTNTGIFIHYKCESCGKLFSDSKCEHEITEAETIIPKLKHDLIHVEAKEATCTEEGNKEYYECRDEDCQITAGGCGKKYSDPYGQHEITDVVIHAKGHDIKKVAAVATTCTKDGHEEYYECSRCHEKFSGKDGNIKIDEIKVIPKLGHDPKAVRGKRATRDNDGNKGHYVCSRCGKKFWDKACKRPADDKEIVIPAIGAAKLGEKATVKGLIYQVTNPSTNGSGTVSLLGIEGQIENVTIPATVVIKETTYKVDLVGAEAFSGNKALKSVVIGGNVLTIDSKAFYGCSSLTSVTGGDNVITIGTKAFAGCKKLKTFKIISPVLAKIGSSAFSGDKKLKTVYIKNTTKLTKSGVKKSLKGSKVKTVKVKKSKVKAYKKIFKKKNSGRTVKVKK